MKILYITDLNLTEREAPVVHIIEVVNNLAKLGHDVTLFAPRSEKPKTKKINTKIKYLPVIQKHILSSYQPILFFILLYNIIKNKPDIIYTRQGSFLIVPALLSNLFFIPYITEINGTLEEELEAEKNPRWLIKIAIGIEKICYSLASRIIATSASLRVYIINKYRLHSKKVLSIDNGVDTNLFKPRYKKLLIKNLKFKINQHYIGYVGGLQHWQGLDYLIKSAKKITKEIPNCKFIIVGDGPEKSKLENLTKKLGLEKNVIFIKSVGHNKVPDYINSFDVSICYLTRFKEGKYGTPFKVYEYLSCGSPVVMSDIKGLSQIFKEVVVLAKPEDSKDLAEKIIKLIKNPKLREQLGRKGRSFILNGHSWKDVAKKTERVFRQALKQHRSQKINWCLKKQRKIPRDI